MKKIIKLNEEQLKELIRTSVRNCLDSEQIIQEEYNKLAITESLIGETMSTLPEGEKWQKELLAYLYHKLNREYKNGNVQGQLFLGNLKDNTYTGDAPNIPFIEYYLIDINYRFIGNSKTEGDCKSGKMLNGKLLSQFTLDIITSSDTLLSQLYTFIYHEFLHAWQQSQLKTDVKELTPYKIQDNDLNDELYQPVKCINYILYFTNILERGAFTSEAIGELQYRYQHDKKFAELPTYEQMEMLFVTKEFGKVKEYINYLCSIDNPNELFGIVKDRLANQLDIKCKNYNEFVKMLDKRFETCYERYRHKVSKWLQHTHIDECITWYL